MQKNAFRFLRVSCISPIIFLYVFHSPHGFRKHSVFYWCFHSVIRRANFAVRRIFPCFCILSSGSLQQRKSHLKRHTLKRKAVVGARIKNGSIAQSLLRCCNTIPGEALRPGRQAPTGLLLLSSARPVSAKFSRGSAVIFTLTSTWCPQFAFTRDIFSSNIFHIFAYLRVFFFCIFLQNFA